MNNRTRRKVLIGGRGLSDELDFSHSASYCEEVFRVLFIVLRYAFDGWMLELMVLRLILLIARCA